jgi:hypothetical protein
MMQFSPASIQSIKSISQHALALYWNRLAGGRSFPSIAERENLAGDDKGKGASGSNREAESTDAPGRTVS